jgi:hypothetical protein
MHNTPKWRSGFLKNSITKNAQSLTVSSFEIRGHPEGVNSAKCHYPPWDSRIFLYQHTVDPLPANLHISVARATVLPCAQMPEKHKLHNVRLDDEVWAAVKAMDCSLNQYLRASLIDGGPNGGIIADPPATNFDPASIPGVSTGAPKVEGQWPCRCVHSGCKGSKFMGVSRFQNLCDGCREAGHLGDARSCRACEDDSATGAI